jgi:hypothetical protein
MHRYDEFGISFVAVFTGRTELILDWMNDLKRLAGKIFEPHPFYEKRQSVWAEMQGEWEIYLTGIVRKGSS